MKRRVWQGALVAGALAALSCSATNRGSEASVAAAGTSGTSSAGGAAGVAVMGGSSAGSAGGGGMQPAAVSGGPCNAPTDVFPITCASIVCHEGTSNKLDLLSPGVDQRLLDVPAMGVNCGKTGMKLVDSANPGQSLILLKLTTSPPCGSSMPLGSGPSGLKPEQLSCIHDYVFELAGRAH